MFEHAAALYPTSSAFSNLATLYYRDSLYVKAVSSYQSALDLDDHNHITWGGLAGSYERLGEHDQAVSAYLEAIQRAENEHNVNPHNPDPLASLANYYVSVGDSMRAREAVGQAAALNPERRETTFDVGLAYEQLGEREEALHWIGRALEQGFAREGVESAHALAELIRDPRYVALMANAPQSEP